MTRLNGRLTNRRRLVEVNPEGDSVESGRKLSSASASDVAAPEPPAEPAPCAGGSWYDAKDAWPDRQCISGGIVPGFGAVGSGKGVFAPPRPGMDSFNVTLASSLVRKGPTGEPWSIARVCLRCRWGAFPAELPDAPETRYGRGQVCADVPLDPYASFSPDQSGSAMPGAAVRLVKDGGRRLPGGEEAAAHPSSTCVQDAVARFGAEAVRACLGPRAYVSTSAEADTTYSRLCDARGALKGSSAGTRRSKMSMLAEATAAYTPSGRNDRTVLVASATFDVPVCSEAEAKAARAAAATKAKGVNIEGSRTPPSGASGATA